MKVSPINSPSSRKSAKGTVVDNPQKQIARIEHLLRDLELMIEPTKRESILQRVATIRQHLDNAYQNLQGKKEIPSFLSLFSQGEERLHKVQQLLSGMRSDELAPGDFLQIQLELGRAQHQIEMGSIFIAKTVDALKSLFNMQI